MVSRRVEGCEPRSKSEVELRKEDHRYRYSDVELVRVVGYSGTSLRRCEYGVLQEMYRYSLHSFPVDISNRIR